MTLLTKAREKFINHLSEKGRAGATVIAYSKDIEQLVMYITEKENKLNADDVSKSDIENFLKYLAEHSYTKKTISRKINAIKTFFKYLTDIGLITSDPSQLIQHPKLEQNAPRILSKLEYRALRDTVKDDVRTKAIFEILIQTGVKISELQNIQQADIKLSENPDSAGTLTIPHSDSSTGRLIPLNKAVQEAVRNYLKERPNAKSDNLFITKTGNPLLVRNIRATLDRYFKQVGLSDVTVNDLRHTFIAEHLRMGASVLLVSKIAGHKRLSTTENYLRYVERKESGIGELAEL
ncbi:MAG: hypothetical protein QG570_127 [Patescibacteria group bacterium]|nr:hypothetical protein [Patescibacteria group bacterium]